VNAPRMAPSVARAVVIKVGGRVQQDPALAAALAAAWRARRAAGGALVVVHGGGDEVSALQRMMGVEPAFVAGRRVTSPSDIETLRMALSGSANKRLVARLVAAGVPALGLSGEDGALLAARRNQPALGAVGAPAAVDVALLAHLVAGGYLPVLSPLSADVDAGDGSALNVNGDDAASAIAAALGAEELLLVADVPGVLLGGEPATILDAAAAHRAIASGDARGGMAAKLEAALAAILAGVGRVRIGDLAAIGDASRGTAIVARRDGLDDDEHDGRRAGHAPSGTTAPPDRAAPAAPHAAAQGV